jgi:protein-S-isoprenylcysteine O-methyltransferase Ste14
MTFYTFFQLGVLVTFFAVITTKIILLRRSRINAIAVGRGKRGFQLAFELASFAGFAVWIVEMVLYAIGSRYRIFGYPLDIRLFESQPLRILGVILMAAGVIIFIYAFVSFGKSWRIGMDVDKPGELVTRGIFAVTRNPIYVFIDLWFLGVFLINGTLIFLILLILAMAHVHYQVLQEEAFCSDLYGDDYTKYRSRTPRYLFF